MRARVLRFSDGALCVRQVFPFQTGNECVVAMCIAASRWLPAPFGAQTAPPT